MNEIEKKILCGLLGDVLYLAEKADGDDRYVVRYDSIEREELRLAKEESIAKTRLSDWLGFKAQEKDWKAASRAYATLEASGYIKRVRQWGVGLTHLQLLPAGRAFAKKLTSQCSGRNHWSSVSWPKMLSR